MVRFRPKRMRPARACTSPLGSTCDRVATENRSLTFTPAYHTHRQCGASRGHLFAVGTIERWRCKSMQSPRFRQPATYPVKTYPGRPDGSRLFQGDNTPAPHSDRLARDALPKAHARMPRARIYRPARSPVQSGGANTRSWILKFEPEVPLFIEPLMGWTGSTDPLRQVRMSFPDRESAVRFALRQGYDFTVCTRRDRRALPFTPQRQRLGDVRLLGDGAVDANRSAHQAIRPAVGGEELGNAA